MPAIPTSYTPRPFGTLLASCKSVGREFRKIKLKDDMKMTKTIRKPVRTQSMPKTLDAVITKIKGDVQAFTAHYGAVQRDTVRLAPMVAQAFKMFKDENASATKLDFCKLFATKEQLASWPTTDAEAKTSGSAAQTLFNGIEYLLRRAVLIQKLQAAENARQQTEAQAEDEARKLAKERGLKGDDADNFVETYVAEAIRQSIPERTRLSADAVAELIKEGWYQDLDDYSIFAAFVAKLLGLKYSERTTQAILQNAEERIVAAQAQEHTPEAAAAPPTQVPVEPVIAPQRPATIPFRRHAAA